MEDEIIERIARAIAPSAFKTLESPQPPFPGSWEKFGETRGHSPKYDEACRLWSKWRYADHNADRARTSAKRALAAMKEMGLINP